MDFNKRENNHAYKLNLGNRTSRSIHSSQSNKRTNWVGDKAFEETSIQYLQNTNIFKDMNIQEIAVKTNFANQSSLGRFFRKHTGMSLSQYRMSNLG